jgi:hypothetical protein
MVRRSFGFGFGVVVGALGVVSPAAADPSTTSPEQGYDMGDMQHPRALAMGGAHAAFGTSTSAVLYNPANLPFSRVYHFEALGAWSPEARRQSYGGAIADSSTSKVTGGFAATWNVMDPDGAKRTWLDLRAAAAYPLGDKLSIGATVRYLRMEAPVGFGPFGPSRASGGTPDIASLNAITFDAGIAVAPVTGLKIGLVGRNLTNPGVGYAPTALGGGVGYTASIFTVEGDLLADFTTYGTTKTRTMLGAELFLADHFPIRAGYRYDDGFGLHSASFGLGYVDKRFSLEASGRREFAQNPSTMISIGLRYFLDVATTQEPQGEF